jgi:hypothetical protein
VTWPTAGKVVDAALLDQWDIAFLAIDPAREDQLCFTPPMSRLKVQCWSETTAIFTPYKRWIARA